MSSLWYGRVAGAPRFSLGAFICPHGLSPFSSLPCASEHGGRVPSEEMQSLQESHGLSLRLVVKPDWEEEKGPVRMCSQGKFIVSLVLDAGIEGRVTGPLFSWH